MSFRHRCDDVFSPPRSRPDGFMASSERPSTVRHEDGQSFHQKLFPGSSDEHLLRSGAVAGEGEWWILQVHIVSYMQLIIYFLSTTFDALVKVKKIIDCEQVMA